jgi:hypothetical protein
LLTSISFLARSDQLSPVVTLKTEQSAAQITEIIRVPLTKNVDSHHRKDCHNDDKNNERRQHWQDGHGERIENQTERKQHVQAVEYSEDAPNKHGEQQLQYEKIDKTFVNVE